MFDFSAISNVVFAVGRMGTAGAQLTGTAFSLNKSSYFATASHVAGNDDSGLVLCFKKLANLNDYQDTADNSIQTFPVKIAASDPFHDLAVLKADIPHATNISIAGADSAPVGTSISSFGFPHADHGRMVLTRQDTEIGARVESQSCL